MLENQTTVLPIPFKTKEDSNPIALMMRQPSFAALVGHLQTKAGDDLADPKVIVFDPARTVPESASDELMHSSLYDSFSRPALNVHLNEVSFDDSLENSPSNSPSNLLDHSNSFTFNPCRSQMNLGSFDSRWMSESFPSYGINRRAKDRRTQIMNKLSEINASRWEKIGYIPSMDLNPRNFTPLDA
ncbi:hypothetical protein TRFO_09872 [Tritrichomonas foetus]|uniref:Uncharacterized protein n=1 Tax=Tritrichomonas foetus TaxID=1144522 RepID=A0A1J4JCT9_9EUKA|nr:hypothetical protein TRFO_09872 [Tritrichomonas foetus]|eukprot:OHS96497.1 hypothetical protein TRFO_09872 [Tritrichomonas foetus]